MPQQQKQAKGIPTRAKRGRGRCDKFFDYDAQTRLVAKKLRRILKSSGVDEAKRWAKSHGEASKILDTLLK